jgi:hypothetical protein
MDNIRMNLREIGRCGQAYGEHSNELSSSMKGGKFVDSLSDY